MLTVLLVVAAYLCGSLPTGEWFAGQAGVNLRRAGSGNVGATNVARTAGIIAGLLTLIADIAKGYLPTLLSTYTPGDRWHAVLVGFVAFLGHIYPIFSRFEGGKGAATAFGVYLCLTPPAAEIALVVFLAVALSTRYVSLASMIGTLTLGLSAAVLGYRAFLWMPAVIMAGIIIVRHRSNITRLRRGQEPTFQFASRA
jgi:glycerol-3-phosphate acyltransferase PlsY